MRSILMMASLSNLLRVNHVADNTLSAGHYYIMNNLIILVRI